MLASTNRVLCLIFVFGCVLPLSVRAKPTFEGKSQSKLADNVNGGVGCAACTILVGLTEQLAIVYNQTIEQSLEDICNFLPKESIFQVACKQAIEQFGPMIIDG